MALDHSLVGQAGEPVEQSWTSTDALLYALGVGAGQADPLAELSLTTENSQDVTQQVLPSFAVVLAQNAGRQNARQRGGRRLGDFDPAMLVHAEQSVELHRPLPVEGTARISSAVTGIYDKGSGALVASQAQAYEVDSGELLATSLASVFIRGEGGFGGERGPSVAWQRPAGDPDHSLTAPTRRDQALLYRLSGDRNPLHSDPKFAARAGFPAPILHGLCTYGITCRVLIAAVCGGDTARFRSMSGRFSAPVFPGDILTVNAWVDGGTARFQTVRQDGTTVLDRGEFVFSA
jgi:acyl dehydratase